MLDRLQAWFRTSLLACISASLVDRLATAATVSKLGETSQTLVRWTRRSVLYELLATVREPAVIRVDLEKTYAIGPPLRLLEHLANTIAHAWRNSRSYEMNDRFSSSRLWNQIVSSKAILLLRSAIEPSER